MPADLLSDCQLSPAGLWTVTPPSHPTGCGVSMSKACPFPGQLSCFLHSWSLGSESPRRRDAPVDAGISGITTKSCCGFGQGASPLWGSDPLSANKDPGFKMGFQPSRLCFLEFHSPSFSQVGLPPQASRETQRVAGSFRFQPVS